MSAHRVLDRCLSAGARLARSGEFTLRAFLNGRLDLSQAESVMALVTARTATAADSALAGLQVRFFILISRIQIISSMPTRIPSALPVALYSCSHLSQGESVMALVTARTATTADSAYLSQARV